MFPVKHSYGQGVKTCHMPQFALVGKSELKVWKSSNLGLQNHVLSQPPHLPVWGHLSATRALH